MSSHSPILISEKLRQQAILREMQISNTMKSYNNKTITPEIVKDVQIPVGNQILPENNTSHIQHNYNLLIAIVSGIIIIIIAILLKPSFLNKKKMNSMEVIRLHIGKIFAIAVFSILVILILPQVLLSLKNEQDK